MIPVTSRTSSSSNINLSFVKQEAQRCLTKLLNKFEGTKTIVWDDKLIGPFEFVSNASQLRELDAVKFLRLSDHRLIFTTDTDYTLFFLRKNYQVAIEVADILQRADKDSLAKSSLVFIPQRCASIEKLLEHYKVDLTKLNSIEELPIELFVLDTDVLSMENEFVYRDIYHDQDYSSIHQIVEGLTKLQSIYGTIPKISGQGKAAKLVRDLLMKRRKLQPNNATVNQTSASQINHLILIDRRIDLISPLLTQLTYEGLLDELFGIQHGNISLPNEKFLKTEEQKKLAQQKPEVRNLIKKIELKSAEELYAKLRDCHINAVGEVLRQSAKNLQAEYDECKSEGKTIHEMRKIVKRVGHLKIAQNSQSNHVTIAEMINEQSLKPEFIFGLRIEHELLQEDRIGRVVPDIELKLLRQEDPMHVLRLICLQSILHNGLKPKISEYYKREIIKNYGDEYLLLLMRLEKTNLLLSHERYYENGSFSQLKSKFNLINDSVDECNPNHMSYVYGGYSPLSVVVVKTLAGSCSKSCLVFFIGGCTFAEISAIRFISEQEECEILIGTTKIINGKTFIGSINMDKFV